MPVHEAPNVMRARLDIRRLAYELAWVAGFVVVLALLSPLGILRHDGLGARLFYWARTVGVGYVLHRPALWLGGWLALKVGAREWAGWIGGLLVACVPMSLWLWYFGPSINPARSFPDDGLWAETAGQVLVISGLISVCLWFIESLLRRDDVPAPPADPDTADARPALLSRLPFSVDARLIALEGEDHYVRVHTDRGSHLVLIRMADAIAETAPLAGRAVHRSWWVARHAVKSTDVSGRNLILKLDKGLCVTVARSRAPEVRRWLDGKAD